MVQVDIRQPFSLETTTGCRHSQTSSNATPCKFASKAWNIGAFCAIRRATVSRVVNRAERRAVEALQAQSIGPKAIDPQTSASFEVADEELLRSLGP